VDKLCNLAGRLSMQQRNHQSSEVASWLAGNCCLGETKKDREAARQLFDVLARSGESDEKAAAAEVARGADVGVAVVSYLRSQAVRLNDPCSEHAASLLKAMSCSNDAVERDAARLLLQPAERNWVSIGFWLGKQMLIHPRRSVPFLKAKDCLEEMAQPKTGHARTKNTPKPKSAYSRNITWKDEDPQYLAAADAIVWMVQHTLPAELISKQRLPDLLSSSTEPAAREWAARVFDRHLVRHYLSHGRWVGIRRESSKKFGFDFADAAVNLVWRRLGTFRDGKSGFFAWLNTVSSNYWTELNRKSGLVRAEQDKSVDQLRKKAYEKTPPPDRVPLPTRLSTFSLNELMQWPPIDCVLFVCEAGIWELVPSHLWNGWLTALKIGKFDQLVRRIANTEERRTMLAKMVKMRPNTLAQRWRRLQPRLENLRPFDAIR